MKNLLIFKKIIFIALLVLLIMPQLVLAEKNDDSQNKDNTTDTPLTGLQKVGTTIGNKIIPNPNKPLTPPQIIGGIIKIILSLLGITFLVLILYGGFLWMTARGNEQQVTKARQILTHATIGLVIVLAAYGIAHFVIKEIVGATTGMGGGGVDPQG